MIIETPNGKVVLAESYPYGGDRAPSLMGQPYNDIEKYRTTFNYACPIKSMVIWAGVVVDGIEVTYNLSDGSTATEIHGARSGGKNEIPLLPTERIMEVKGLSSFSGARGTDWGVQVQELSMKIYNSANGCFRDTKTFGTPNENYTPESRKDICACGPLVGFSGVANNNLPMGKSRLI
ncbi:hypothetical protein FRC12_010394 [Ceratobasidium sp. 428]|nr:hypothetical protein FRC12_010394 [Ceratobasidium sp. 428]